jgi:hypothetical protein
MILEKQISGIAEEWRRPGNSRLDKLFRISQRSARSFGLDPALGLYRALIVELDKPPSIMRGFSDLVVRKGEPGDIPGMCAVIGADPALYRGRFARGDLAYVGLVDGEILCQTWFHRGPTPFAEERSMFALWDVDDSTYWSYDAMTRPDARTSGIFVKVFQTALREVLEVHGGRKIQGFIHHTNDASLRMHDRLRFSILGSLTCLAVPGFKFLRWADGRVSRQWLVAREGDLALRFPVA